MANILFEIASKIPLLRDIQQVYSERDALRQLYDRDNYSGGIVPGKYYQQIDPGTGNVKGFSAVCHCGIEYRMLSMFECLRGYKCPTCKMDINVLKFVDAVDAEGRFKVTDKKVLKAQELESRLSKLPVRPVGVGGPANSGTMMVGDHGGPVVNSPDEFWDGKPPLGSDGRWV